MVDLGMPTLTELPELEDCAALCRELGLQFLELNMDLPQYQVSAIDPTRFQAVQGQTKSFFYQAVLHQPEISTRFFRVSPVRTSRLGQG